MRANTRRFRLALTWLTLVVLMLSVFAAVPVRAATINVPVDYATIQAAIDAANGGDTVLVAPGTYVENIDFKGKALTVESESGPAVTTINGSGSGSVVTFKSGEGPGSVIKGFTITNGAASNASSRGAAGGGILCDGASPTIISNVITGNRAENTGEGGGAGGGIALTQGASAIIKQNTITENDATTDYLGGGWDSGATAGGGILVDWNSEPIIEDNVITDNYGYNNKGWGHSAGGIAVVHWANATITRNTITRNIADQDASGGGIVVTFGAQASVDRNFITHNEATNKRTRYSAAGGGFFCDKGAQVDITNNVIAHNSAIDTATADATGGDAGGGIMQKWEGNNLRVINNVIFDNYAESARGYAAGGICQGHWTDQITIFNDIIWNNRVGVGYPAMPDLRQYQPDVNKAYVTYNDISQEVFPGVGNIQADPLFVDPGGDDFHLQSSSPCIDTGTNVGAPPIDLEGRIRPWDGDGDLTAVVDMGAYEYGAPLPDTEGPITSDVVADPNSAPVGTPIDLTANVDDSTTGGSNIASAKYNVDDGSWSGMSAQDSAFDEVSEDVTANIGSFEGPGVHEICVRGTDAAGNLGGPECILLAIYDPTAGFVTGGGWIDSPSGAYTPDDPDDPDLTGKATFGFVSRYKKGATVPTGQTEFQFRVADLNFHSTSYQWLVIAGARAQYKGSGTINGAGDYGFMLTAIDGQINGGGGTDKFRIKIWNKATDSMIYDNKAGESDTGDAATELGGGSIVIHKKK